MRPEARPETRLQGGSEGSIYLQCSTLKSIQEAGQRQSWRLTLLQHYHNRDGDEMGLLGLMGRGQRKQQGGWAGPRKPIGALRALTYACESLVS